jgi:acyl-coenzyme A thioesterase PaaI-like protein
MERFEKFFKKASNSIKLKIGMALPETPEEFEQSFLDPMKCRGFFLSELPSLAFFGVSVSKLTQAECHVELPFTWRTQNPFQSVYFAAQAGAAELATGLLVLRALAGKSPVSMLVVGMEASFSKKAKRDVRFVCENGEAIHLAVERALAGEDVDFVAESVGRLADGTEVSRFKIKWALKAKKA